MTKKTSWCSVATYTVVHVVFHRGRNQEKESHMCCLRLEIASSIRRSRFPLGMHEVPQVDGQVYLPAARATASSTVISEYLVLLYPMTGFNVALSCAEKLALLVCSWTKLMLSFLAKQMSSDVRAAVR